jgi:hypothetical protein
LHEDLDEEDIVLWSERQAQLLRRRAAGERVNEDDIDWARLAEGNRGRGVCMIGSTRTTVPQSNGGLSPCRALFKAATAFSRASTRLGIT